MSVFNDITGFEKFNITADVDSVVTVYANSCQQARVYVHMTASDKDGNYVTLTDSELTKLQDAITLVNYNNNSPLTKVDKYAYHKSDWSYTTTEGEYEQPEVKRNIAARSDTQMTFTFYVMCPIDENERNIKVAASVKLGNGAIVDTVSGHGFESHVELNARDPIVYEINYKNNVQSESDNLRVTRNRVRDTELSGDPAWVDNYSVSIRGGKFGYREAERSRNIVESASDRWKLVHGSLQSIYVSAWGYSHQIANVCYFFEVGDPTSNMQVGYWGLEPSPGFKDVPVNQDKSLFNFTVARTEDTDDSYNDTQHPGVENAYVLCRFADQFGNVGQFYAYPNPDSGDYYYRGSKFEFSTNR